MTVHLYILQQIIAYRYYYIHTGCNRYKKNTPPLWVVGVGVLVGWLGWSVGFRVVWCVGVSTLVLRWLSRLVFGGFSARLCVGWLIYLLLLFRAFLGLFCGSFGFGVLLAWCGCNAE
jgi:hypothetical protein